MKVFLDQKLSYWYRNAIKDLSGTDRFGSNQNDNLWTKAETIMTQQAVNKEPEECR
jgi:hypothetical protein